MKDGVREHVWMKHRMREHVYERDGMASLFTRSQFSPLINIICLLYLGFSRLPHLTGRCLLNLFTNCPLHFNNNNLQALTLRCTPHLTLTCYLRLSPSCLHHFSLNFLPPLCLSCQILLDLCFLSNFSPSCLSLVVSLTCF